MYAIYIHHFFFHSFSSVQYGCETALRIPVADDDGDIVRCRWSEGSECVSICNAQPLATLDSVSNIVKMFFSIS